MHASHRSHASLEDIYHPTESDHRPHQQTEIQSELNELADSYRSADDQMPAVPQDCDEPKTDKELQDRVKNPGQPYELQITIHELPVDLFEALYLRVFLCVGPNYPHA